MGREEEVKRWIWECINLLMNEIIELIIEHKEVSKNANDG